MFQRSQGSVNAFVPESVPKQLHSTAMAPGLLNRHRRPSELDYHHAPCTPGCSVSDLDMEVYM